MNERSPTASAVPASSRSDAERAEREAKLREPAVERLDKPIPALRPAPTQRERAPKPAIAPVSGA